MEKLELLKKIIILQDRVIELLDKIDNLKNDCNTIKKNKQKIEEELAQLYIKYNNLEKSKRKY